MKRPEDIFYEGIAEQGEPQEEQVKEAAELPAPVVRPVTQKNLFANPETHPVVLDMALLRAFKFDWFPWISDTLFREIELTFKTSIADINKVKIMAMQTLHVTDAFWEEWEIFEKGILALNGVMPRLSVMQPPDLLQLLSGVDMVKSVREEEYAEEVARYCAAVFLHEHVHYAPEPLDFCQPFISQPMYRCRDCDQHGSALPPFSGLCEACVLVFDQDKPFAFKPDPERVQRGYGKNLELFLTFDPESTRKRFEQLDALPPEKVDIKETAEDIQAAKLIVANDYMKMRTRQLKEQLEALQGWLGDS